MSNSNQRLLIEQIHRAGKRLVVALTGGGSGAISCLLQVPGASASVLEAVVPYSAAALDDWLGGPADQYCSERTARAMAMAAFERARTISGADPAELRGVGATASLVSNRPKRGAHRLHAAWQSADTTAVLSCELENGARSRREEEQVAAALILQLVAEACGVMDQLNIELPENVMRRRAHSPPERTELLLGKRASVIAGSFVDDSANPRGLFPGAFNPLHEGHVQMAALAAQRIGSPVVFEISITNVDKPPLDFIEIKDRLAGLAGRPVMLTRAATFVEKSKLAPGCVFIVGADTIERIGECRYYGDDAAQREMALAEIAENRCRFLVFGRADSGRFRALNDLQLPPSLRALCEEVSETEFRADLSSTQLRSDDLFPTRL